MLARWSQYLNFHGFIYISGMLQFGGMKLKLCETSAVIDVCIYRRWVIIFAVSLAKQFPNTAPVMQQTILPNSLLPYSLSFPKLSTVFCEANKLIPCYVT